jgi:hypothetical protein
VGFFIVLIGCTQWTVHNVQLSMRMIIIITIIIICRIIITMPTGSIITTVTTVNTVRMERIMLIMPMNTTDVN